MRGTPGSRQQNGSVLLFGGNAPRAGARVELRDARGQAKRARFWPVADLMDADGRFLAPEVHMGRVGIRWGGHVALVLARAGRADSAVGI